MSPSPQPTSPPSPPTAGPRVFVWGSAFFTTALAAAVFADVLRADGVGVLDVVLLLLFTILFLWIAQGFWTAALGVWVVLRQQRAAQKGGAGQPAVTEATSSQSQHNDAQPSPSPSPEGKEAEPNPPSALPHPPSFSPLPRTAIVMPIYNEDPNRVMAGIRAIYDDLQATGEGDAFDLFIVSDTTDPENWLHEEAVWASVCLDACSGEPGKSQIFYRRRPFNIARKSGNIADFCTHWGRLYEFMVVLDADSLMSGETIVEMTRRMAADPKLAILQAPPQPINKDSLFTRMMQFAAAMYSPIFTAGFAAWTGNDGNYYGHNAIIRTQAFMDHCGLPRLPGEAPLGGEILSHDFVEAAMLRRSGYRVRIDPDLVGSYEEMPTTLIDYAKRDRRWCQGNMQHIRIALAKNMHPVSRTHLFSGAMAYLSSPLWLSFMVLMAVAQVVGDEATPAFQDWFGSADLARWEALGLFLVCMTMLLLPKLWAWLVMLRDPRRTERFGGKWRALLSVLGETAFSVLLAPVMMAFHSRFVFETLSGHIVHWAPQERDERGTAWREAWGDHKGQVIAGAIAAVVAMIISWPMFWWLTPVLLGLLLAPAVSVLTSRLEVGRAARALKLFLIPAETDPPRVLYTMHQRLADAEVAAEQEAKTASALPAATKDRFRQAILDPTFNTLHVSLLRAYGTPVRETPQLAATRRKALEQGPDALTKQEKLAILSHEETVRWLHGAAWQRWNIA